MAAELTRIVIQLSEADTRLLDLWARLHGRPRSTYAAQIVSARLEANADLIRKEVADYAQSQGKSFSEIEREWLGDTEE
jgi:hypothetical protein